MRATISVIAGVAGTILTFGIVYVRGDGAGIISFLRSRAELRRLKAEETDPEIIQSAQAALQAQATALAHPQLALQLWPLELLVGLIIGLAVFWAFRHNYRQLSTKARPDIQERMAIRLVHRIGRPFALSELSTFERYSPLNTTQLHAAFERLIHDNVLIPQPTQQITTPSQSEHLRELRYWLNPALNPQAHQKQAHKENDHVSGTPTKHTESPSRRSF